MEILKLNYNHVKVHSRICFIELLNSLLFENLSILPDFVSSYDLQI